MKKILITAFEPFGGRSTNASLDVMNHHKFDIENTIIETLVLPTAFKSVEAKLLAKMNDFNPHIILHLGEAGGAKNIRLERVAINLDDARIKDNLNDQPIDEKIKEDGQNAYFSTLPIRKIHQALSNALMPTIISYSAGTFVCNHLMYLTLHHLSIKKASDVIAGFIHFPYIEVQPNNPKLDYLDLNTSVKALEIIIKSCL
jgi:pyroglutamyl-peptidase